MARILAVDDSAAMRQMVGITLTGAGHDVQQAADGDEALQIAAMAGRFAPGDLESIIDARQSVTHRPDPASSLQPGTAGWASLGIPSGDEQ